MAYKNKTYKSKIPPPSWDQVVFLFIGGVIQLALLIPIILYVRHLDTIEAFSTWATFARGFYAFWMFLSIVGVSAIVLAAFKSVVILVQSRQRKVAARVVRKRKKS
jgi:hypothetical protein